MKKILAIFLALATVAMADGTNYGNVVTMQTCNILPTHLYQPEVFNPTLKQLQERGWRYIVEIEQPAAGWVVYARQPEEINETTCRLIITSQDTQANIDARAESNRLARIEWDKEMIQNTVDNDPLQYGIGWHTCNLMVRDGTASTMAEARQMILDKAYTKINTNAP